MCLEESKRSRVSGAWGYVVGGGVVGEGRGGGEVGGWQEMKPSDED